ncbi:MAG: Uma2 family endonuclease [Armatimonadetes bacterium]|nr:Uma2 family endonuclease [Armatimonadota bacterium]CUU36895.1 Endonuclease, Uma2 family (restriction endonuclease fold) [Armatimonadetes bacterium DC]
MTSTATRGIGWEEYLQLPLTRYEIIDGEVKELPTPLFKHQMIVSELMLRLGAQIRSERKGYLLPAPYDVVIRRSPLRTRQPDLLFISHERAQTIPDLPNQPRLEIAPDLIIEVLSPSDTASDWLEKLRDYHQIGVREVWVVDPQSASVEVLGWSEAGWRSLGVFTQDQPIRSEVLGETSIQPATLFECA